MYEKSQVHKQFRRRLHRDPPLWHTINSLCLKIVWSTWNYLWQHSGRPDFHQLHKRIGGNMSPIPTLSMLSRKVILTRVEFREWYLDKNTDVSRQKVYQAMRTCKLNYTMPNADIPHHTITTGKFKWCPSNMQILKSPVGAIVLINWTIWFKDGFIAPYFWKYHIFMFLSKYHSHNSMLIQGHLHWECELMLECNFSGGLAHFNIQWMPSFGIPIS